MNGEPVDAMRLSRCFFIFISCWLVLAAWPAGGAAPSPLAITGIRTGLGAGGTRLTIELSGKADFRAFHLAKPYRIAVDLPATRWQAPKSGVMSGGLVRGYRSGMLENGLTRVIFDLGRAAVIGNAVLAPRSGSEKDRILIDLMPSSDNLYTARLGQVFGAREINATSARPPPSSSYAQEQDRIVRSARLPTPAETATGDVTEIVKGERNSFATTPKSGGMAVPARKFDRKYTVVIDAGHGGGDPGAIGQGGVYEKRLTLSIAKELARQLAETGRYRAVLTRSSDNYIKLRERVAIAKRAKADLFISIHADKIGRTGVRGASIYTLSQNASDKETARLAEQENNSGVVAGVDLANESQDVADILLDLAMREKMNESKLLARFIETAFGNKSITMLPNSHRAAGFAVLKAPDVPAVLIETGFLSNPEEAKLLSSSAFQRRIAGAMVDGVDAYFRKIQALQKL
ncbi:MAG TPA: N-acetylmuramoyl-L-alanine amidase [Patescibacteria group bacterium]|nr:N-acetylmuramoyl-L-alanine amidase [Patescibacteria group bacterium]